MGVSSSQNFMLSSQLEGGKKKEKADIMDRIRLALSCVMDKDIEKSGKRKEKALKRDCSQMSAWGRPLGSHEEAKLGCPAAMGCAAKGRLQSSARAQAEDKGPSQADL